MASSVAEAMSETTSVVAISPRIGRRKCRKKSASALGGCSTGAGRSGSIHRSRPP